MTRGFLPLLCLLMAASVAWQGPEGGSTAPRPLPFFYDLYMFRGEAGHTDVVASFAVPVRRLQRERWRGEVRYRFDVTLVLADTALQSVARTDDSVYVAVPRSLPGDHLLFTHVELQARPSATILQRVIMTDATTPGIGQLYGSPFPIRDYTGTDLMLSDIALGQPDARAGWTRGDVTLALLPSSQFPGSTFDIYYEIYNLPFGHRYTTEISIEPIDDSEEGRPGEGDPVRTRFSGESAARAGASQNELRRVEASLANGRYRLTVAVTDDVSKATATRSRILRVTEGGRGATLVPALPSKRSGWIA